MKRDLVLEEGRYKAVYSEQWLRLERGCVYSVENASPVAGSVPEKQLTSFIGE
jgi:hypothetical protein